MSSPVLHLLVDARPVDHPTARGRGIGRYVTGLLGGLTEIEAPFTALVGSPDEAGLLGGVVDPERIKPWSPAVVRDNAHDGTWYLATQLMLHPVPLDPIPRVVTAARLPVAAVMYDVIPYRHPARYLVDPPALRLAQIRAPMARTVDALLAISDFAAETAAEELSFPRQRIRTIGAGVESRFSLGPGSSPPRFSDRRPSTEGRFVVTIGGSDDRKNIVGLLRAWARTPREVRDSHQLVVVGAHTPALLRTWRSWAEEAGVADDEVLWTGAIDDDELIDLLRSARLSVMPSIEEGFGLPVLEAAACGCISICSATTSLPEVLDEPLGCFDPHDEANMAAAITRALLDDDHRRILTDAARRAAERWRWPRVAADTLEALADLGPRWGGRPRRPAPVVGLTGSSQALADLDRSALGLDGIRVVELVDTSDTSVSRPAPSPVAVADRWNARALGRFVKPWDLDLLVQVGRWDSGAPVSDRITADPPGALATRTLDPAAGGVDLGALLEADRAAEGVTDRSFSPGPVDDGAG